MIGFAVSIEMEFWNLGLEAFGLNGWLELGWNGDDTSSKVDEPLASYIVARQYGKDGQARNSRQENVVHITEPVVTFSGCREKEGHEKERRKKSHTPFPFL
jgi:hypothetical protein